MLMKILVVGAGGISSWLVPELIECIKQGQIDAFTSISIADNDMVEMKQLLYQNFKGNEIGMNKARALGRRFKEFKIRAIAKRIEEGNQLQGYNIIILCVDNEKTREMAIRYCFKTSKEFIDLRASGRRIFAMPKANKLEDNLKFVDSKDLKNYSCQEKEDLDKGLIQKGNKIVALIGVQMLLNLLRGHNNRTISEVI